jgi:NAD(P)H dehydrogenase (quinone)
VVYQNLTADEHKRALADAGLPEPCADLLVDSDQGIAAGHLEDHSGDLTRLVGHPTITLADVVAASLKTA